MPPRAELRGRGHRGAAKHVYSPVLHLCIASLYIYFIGGSMTLTKQMTVAAPHDFDFEVLGAVSACASVLALSAQTWCMNVPDMVFEDSTTCLQHIGHTVQ